MRRKTIFGLLLCITLVLCLALPPNTTAASEEDKVLQVMKNWFKAFNTCDFDLMSSLHWHSTELLKFAPGGVFLTQGWETIENEWKSSFEGVPVGTYLNTMHHPQVTMLTDNVAIITCYNNQVVTDLETKEQSEGQYRGTFVVQNIGGNWLIVYEHSSQLPVE